MLPEADPGEGEGVIETDNVEETVEETQAGEENLPAAPDDFGEKTMCLGHSSPPPQKKHRK